MLREPRRGLLEKERVVAFDDPAAAPGQSFEGGAVAGDPGKDPLRSPPPYSSRPEEAPNDPRSSRPSTAPVIAP